MILHNNPITFPILPLSEFDTFQIPNIRDRILAIVHVNQKLGFKLLLGVFRS